MLLSTVDTVVLDHKRFCAYRRKNFRENHWRWNGKKIQNGRVQINIGRGAHWRADKKGYIFEYILIYEQFYKCCLLRYAIIHHRNGIKTDDRIENLEATTNSKHAKIHHFLEGKRIEGLRKCFICDSTITDTQKNKDYPVWFIVDKEKNLWHCQKCHSKIYDHNRYLRNKIFNFIRSRANPSLRKYY